MDFCQNFITVRAKKNSFFFFSSIIYRKTIYFFQVPNSEAGANREGYPLRPGEFKIDINIDKIGMLIL